MSEAKTGRFKPGGRSGPGRPKGSKNITSREAREALLGAFKKVGGQKYLERIAPKSPKSPAICVQDAIQEYFTGARLVSVHTTEGRESHRRACWERLQRNRDAILANPTMSAQEQALARYRLAAVALYGEPAAETLEREMIGLCWPTRSDRKDAAKETPLG